MARLAVYLAFARAAFQGQLAYRVANWVGMFTNALFLVFRGATLQACYAARDVIGGLDVHHAVTYAAVSQALIMVCPQWGTLGLAADVRSGQIAVDLLRPVDLVGIHLARRLAISAYYVMVRCIPLLVLARLVGWLAPCADPIAFGISVVLAAWIAASMLFLVELSSFWLESERGVRYLVMGLGILPSGLVLPLHFLPDWMQTITAWTPFPYTLYAPAEIWMGVVASAPTLLAIQLAWGIGLTGVCRAILAAAEARLQVVGG